RRDVLLTIQMQPDLRVGLDDVAGPAEPDAAALVQHVADRRRQPAGLAALGEVSDPVRGEYDAAHPIPPANPVYAGNSRGSLPIQSKCRSSAGCSSARGVTGLAAVHLAAARSAPECRRIPGTARAGPSRAGAASSFLEPCSGTCHRIAGEGNVRP